LLSVMADQLMKRFPVICRIDQKEKNNGSSKSNACIVGA